MQPRGVPAQMDLSLCVLCVLCGYSVLLTLRGMEGGFLMGSHSAGTLGHFQLREREHVVDGGFAIHAVRGKAHGAGGPINADDPEISCDEEFADPISVWFFAHFFPGMRQAAGSEIIEGISDRRICFTREFRDVPVAT